MLSPEARSELTDVMQGVDPKARTYAALALGRAGVADAAPVLVELLSEEVDPTTKSQAVMTLGRLPDLPKAVVTRLRELEGAGIDGVSEHAMLVLSLRDPNSKRPSAKRRVQEDAPTRSEGEGHPGSEEQ